MSAKINIETRQYDVYGNMDTIETKTSGKVFEKNGNVYIIYKENIDGEDITCTIKISENSVSMKRMASFNTDMTIVLGEKRTCRYVIPQGVFLIDTYGKKMKFEQEDSESLKLMIEYDIEIVGMFKGKNRVTVDVKPMK